MLSQIHEMDYLYWFFGMPERMFTLGGHLSSLEIDVEDVTSTLMQCERNGRRFPVHLHQDYVQRPGSRGYKIIGDKGRIEADLLALTVKVYAASGQPAEFHDFRGFQRNELFIEETRRFLACIHSGERPPVDIREAAQSLRMALAAKQSLESGSVVSLSGPGASP